MPLNEFNILLQIFPIILCVISTDSPGAIHGKYTENIKNYHLAVPHKATPDGEFASFHLPHFHPYDAKQFMKRRKRQLDDPDAVHYGVSIDNKLHHLELWPNRDFIHPQAIFEWRDPTLPIKKRQVTGVKQKKMCYYHGRVRGVNNSKVAMATCDGLAGYIHLGSEVYIIEPVHGHTPNSKGHHLHLVYMPDWKLGNNFCGVKNSPEDWERSIKSRVREEYLNDRNVFKRQSVDKLSYKIVPQWMEMMMVADKKMVMKHRGKHRDIEEWLLSIMSVVKYFYSDSTLEGILEPVLVRLIYLEKEEEEIDLNINENYTYTLDNFCNWTAKLQPKDETHPNHFDVAGLLTGWDFCDEVNCNVQGLATIGGACSNLSFNCQINEDVGMTTPTIVAHEQGHLIGMNHDGQGDSPCPPNDTSDNSWYVMSPAAAPKTERWSPCSIASMRQLAENHLLDCFNDQPTSDEYELNKPPIGMIYGLDDQCNMGRRDDPSVTGTCMEDQPRDCTKLPCMSNGRCVVWGATLADGTKCGENKWCMLAECVDKANMPKAIDGKFGEWGEWSTCTKTCGRGVQFKVRLCDNPKPAHHGRFCEGEAKQYRICNPDDCPIDAPSFRDTQCKLLFPKSQWVKGGQYKDDDVGTGAFKTDKPCALSCYLKGGPLVIVAEVIEDGAKCEIGNPLKLCFGGVCKEVGCDGKIEGSDAIMDHCGVCNGDGTRCKIVQGNDSTGFRGPRMVAVIPSGAKNVRLQEMEPSLNFLALGLPDNETVYFNGPQGRHGAGVYPLGKLNRSLFLYTVVPDKDKKDVETIKWDITKEDIGFYIRHVGKKVTTAVSWKWVEPSDSPTRDPKYRWEIAEYKECSAKCGGGTQETVISCYEELAGKVGNKFCEKLDKPAGDTKKCNEEECVPDWKVGTWGPCRACKKKGGVSIREVQCTRPNPTRGDDILVEDSECKSVKPGTVQLCETRKKCGSRKRKAPYVPAKFQETVWQQMNKLHLVKRGITPRVYLKGMAPTSTKRTTKFTWKPPSLPTDIGHRHIVDRQHIEPVDAVEVKLEVVTENGTDQENGLGAPKANKLLVIAKTAIVKVDLFPTKYPKSKRKKANKTTTKH